LNKNVKKIILIGITVLTGWLLYPVIRVGVFYFTDPILEPVNSLTDREVDDAGEVNLSSHGGVIDLSSDLNESILMIREALTRAKNENLKIMPMGARHSMGKQSFQEGAILLNTLSMNGMELDGELLKVQAGARWFEVINFLADLGLTVEIMQSNADFSVGGTLSVNAHGWQPGRPPVASSVEKVSVLMQSGEVQICSRTENADLFRHVLGGYGLFGVILEAWIRPVPNQILQSTSREVKTENFLTAWKQISAEGAELAYGRLSVAPATFFESVWLTRYLPVGEEIAENPEPYLIDGKARLSRAIFRASLGSDRGKSLRHWMERSFGGELSGTSPRSRLLSEPAKVFGNHDPLKRDLLLEYFVPLNQFSQFVQKASPVILREYDSLLNVTVREIAKDVDSAIPYASEDMFGLVMLFTIDRTLEAEKGISVMAGQLIELADSLGGTFYLPYRNFATPAQITRGYPSFSAFLAKKREIDPLEIFSSGFYKKYR
jgi:FAD/FMN-containing dehydrogenase